MEFLEMYLNHPLAVLILIATVFWGMTGILKTLIK